MDNKDNSKYVFAFTYFDSGRTIEMKETDLQLLGLPKETSNLNDYDNWELRNLMAQYWHKNGKATMRERLADGTLSEPIKCEFIDDITKTLRSISGSLSNATRRTLESQVLDQQLVADRINRGRYSGVD